MGEYYTRYPQYQDQDIPHAGPNSYSISWRESYSRIVNWFIQYLPTMKPPITKDSALSAPLRPNTSANPFNPNPLSGSRAAPANAYASAAQVRAPSLGLPGASLGSSNACQTL